MKQGQLWYKSTELEIPSLPHPLACLCVLEVFWGGRGLGIKAPRLNFSECKRILAPPLAPPLKHKKNPSSLSSAPPWRFHVLIKAIFTLACHAGYRGWCIGAGGDGGSNYDVIILGFTPAGASTSASSEPRH